MSASRPGQGQTQVVPTISADTGLVMLLRELPSWLPHLLRLRWTSIRRQTHRHISTWFQNNNDQIKLKKIFQRIDINFGKKIKELLRFKDISAPCGLQHSFQLFQVLINNAIGIFQKQIQPMNYGQKSINLNQLNYRRYLFGKFYKIAKEQIYDINARNIEQDSKKISIKIDQYQNQLKKMIQFRGSLQQNIQNDVDFFQKTFAKQKIKQFKQMVIDQIDKLSLRLRPQDIFKKSMQQTLANKDNQDGKQYYIKCYKLVTNFNRFLFQIMCEYPQISGRDSIIRSCMKKILNQSIKQLNQLINSISLSISENQNQKAREILIKNNMIGIANMQHQSMGLGNIFKNLVDQLIQKNGQIIQRVRKQIEQSNCEQRIVKFVSGPLKDKIIGCQHCCPICVMKCMLPSSHEGSHHVLQNCHSLLAYAGCQYLKTKQPVLDICQGKKSMMATWVGRQQQDNENLQVFLNKYYPKWVLDFPKITQPHKFQKFNNMVELKKIWINIQKLRLLGEQFNPCSDLDVQALRDEYELTQEDLIREYKHPLTKEKYLLRDYNLK